MVKHSPGDRAVDMAENYYTACGCSACVEVEVGACCEDWGTAGDAEDATWPAAEYHSCSILEESEDAMVPVDAALLHWRQLGS